MDDALDSLPLVTPGRELVARDDAPLGPDATVISRGAARGLTSVHRSDIQVALRLTKLGWQRFTFDLPGVDPSTLAHLDDRGLVRVGTAVQPGMVLVGQTTPRRPRTEDATVAGIDALFGVEPHERDTSRRCAPDEGGIVTRVALIPAVGEEPARAEVELTEERPLEVGDLLFADRTVKAVAEITESLPGGADILWPGASGPTRVHKLSCAREVMHARSIAPYSIVTQQPLRTKGQFGGQRVDGPTQALLRRRGADWVLHEMFTVKSDDVEGRTELYISIVRGEPACRPTVPEATRVLDRELAALAFDVDLTAPTPTLRLASDAQIRERSFGEVRKPETINYRTFDPVPGGLFCAAIFGPIRDYECVCGAFSGARNANETCPQCGVEILLSRVRRQRMGHVELPLPVMHPWSYPRVRAALGIDEARLDGVLGGKQRVDGGEPESFRETGVLALRDALLEATGEASPFVFEAWPVLPPDLRPLVPLDGGRFATSDLNDLYRRLINRSNRLKRLFELDAPDRILRSEHVTLQQSVEQLVQNGEGAPPVTGPDDRPLVSLSGMARRPHGPLASPEFGKFVDYSGQAWAVPSHAVAATQVGLPRDMARELFKPNTYWALEVAGHVTTIKHAKERVIAMDAEAESALTSVATGAPLVVVPSTPRQGSTALGLEVVIVDGSVLQLHPETLRELGARVGEPLTVHVPIDPRAVEETRAMKPGQRLLDIDMTPKGWLGRAATSAEFGQVLFDAALEGAREPGEDRLARLLLGRHETRSE